MKYEINMKLPSLNDYIRVCRCNKYQAAKFKADIEQEIGLFLAKMSKQTNPIKLHFNWIEGNKKRDLDNVAFAKKFILDAMQKYGKLENDNRKYVKGFTDNFSYSTDGKFKVEVEIEEDKE
jgi:Holliday junction resolvase RusA-like endonuclease